MKNGWLVVNGYLKSEKFEEIYSWLIEAAEKKNCTLRKISNDQLISILQVSNGKTDWRTEPDFVLFWDKDVRLARLLEAEGFPVFNSADAIEICDDKALTFMNLKNTDIKLPKTFSAPMTFDKEYKDYTFVLQVGSILGYPFIIKENKGSFGEQVYLIKDYSDAVEKIKSIGNCDFIMQEFVESSKGKDVRIHVVGNEIVTAMERTNDNDFRANITNGGTMKKYEPTKEQKEMALKVCRELKLDFAGVDIMYGKEGEPILCEVNSNAHFKNIYDCTGVNVADFILEYILEKIEERR
jgi:RimK family alpha-L-glutamate ligase